MNIYIYTCLDSWKRRYCVLFEDSLCYFKKKEDSYPAGKLFVTHDTLAVFVDENAIGKKFCIALIHPKRTFYMHLDTLQESVEWVYLFRMAIYFVCLFVWVIVLLGWFEKNVSRIPI